MLIQLTCQNEGVGDIHAVAGTGTTNMGSTVTVTCNTNYGVGGDAATRTYTRMCVDNGPSAAPAFQTAARTCQAVSSLVRRYRIETPEQIIVVQDELDLPPGELKIKAGGGLAGHNGLRSITQHLRTQDYLRVRIGVGKPDHKDVGRGHVLSKVPKHERELLDIEIANAADAVELIVARGVDAAMQRYNGKP